MTNNIKVINDLGAALSSSTRVSILRLVTISPMPVGALAKVVGIAQSTASYHVSSLIRAGLVSVREDGARRVVQGRYRGLRVALVS